MNPRDDRRSIRLPRTRAIAALPSILAALLLAGCVGGSGSSGFDLAENSAIMQALDEQQCVESGGLTICPADQSPTPPPDFTVTPTHSPSPTRTPPPTVPLTATPTMAEGFTTPTASDNPGAATATPTQSPREAASPTATIPPASATPTPSPTPTGPPAIRVDTAFGDAASVDCAPAADGCTFAFHFAPTGLPPDASYQVAARRRDPDTGWTLVDAIEVSFNPSMPVYEATIVVPPSGDESVTLQLAVLAYVDVEPPAPGPIELLGDSGAEFAFVTRDLTVIPLVGG